MTTDDGLKYFEVTQSTKSQLSKFEAFQDHPEDDSPPLPFLRVCIRSVHGYAFYQEAGKLLVEMNKKPQSKSKKMVVEMKEQGVQNDENLNDYKF